jgi:predicted RNA-binding protein YlxR (DUF448 family)
MLNNRTCVVCKKRELKSELFRFTCLNYELNFETGIQKESPSAKNLTKNIQVRTSGINLGDKKILEGKKIYARGAYVHKKTSCIEQLNLKHLQYALRLKFSSFESEGQNEARKIAKKLVDSKNELIDLIAV